MASARMDSRGGRGPSWRRRWRRWRRDPAVARWARNIAAFVGLPVLLLLTAFLAYQALTVT